MKRVYNEKISPRANESLTRREHTVQTQKRVIVLVCDWKQYYYICRFQSRTAGS